LSPERIHLAFDALAWLTAFAAARLTRRERRPLDADYLLHLAVGAGLGGLFFGTANLALAGIPRPGHSIAGALAGGIAAVELLKWRRGVRHSTGGGFVLPLALGIAVGRLGCFFAGLSDETYGIPTGLPWGHDFGDGIPRHPVQLYESAAMLAFVLARVRGFHAFVAFYAAQRFLWEFLKPYPSLVGPLDVFQLLCLALLAYAAFFSSLSRTASRVTSSTISS
jgi:prolipoprotein diacylglyceryltransferase